MLRSLYTAATGMDAQQTKLDIIAHNLANTSTTGFKRVRADFEDLLSETIRSATAPTAQGGGRPEALQVGLGVRTATTTRAFSQGDLTSTQNPLDVAIEGTGFFRIQRANGDFAYTRGIFQNVCPDGDIFVRRGLEFLRKCAADVTGCREISSPPSQ